MTVVDANVLDAVEYVARDGARVLLRRGVLDVAGRHALGNGLCLRWAIAQAELGHGSVTVVCDSFNGPLEADDCPVDRGMRHGLHAVLRDGDRLVDVDGVHAPEQALAWFGPGTYLLALTLQQARELSRTDTWRCDSEAAAWVQDLAVRQFAPQGSRCSSRRD